MPLLLLWLKGGRRQTNTVKRKSVDTTLLPRLVRNQTSRFIHLKNNFPKILYNYINFLKLVHLLYTIVVL